MFDGGAGVAFEVAVEFVYADEEAGGEVGGGYVGFVVESDVFYYVFDVCFDGAEGFGVPVGGVFFEFGQEKGGEEDFLFG